MNYYGTDYSYASERLTGSVVQSIDATPILIRDIAGQNVTISKLSDIDTYYTIQLSDIDLTPVKLGWINYKNGLAYVTRIPTRKWKQGLTSENLHIVYVDPGISVRTATKEMGKTILGDYPSFQKVFQAYTENTKKAFSRNWAFNSSFVMYNGRKVGIVQDGEILLYKKDYYLREFFKEVTEVDCGYC